MGMHLYLFHPRYYVLLDSQFPALSFTQSQTFPNLLIWEADLLGSPQAFFWNSVTVINIKHKKECIMDTGFMFCSYIFQPQGRMKCTWNKVKSRENGGERELNSNLFLSINPILLSCWVLKILLFPWRKYVIQNNNWLLTQLSGIQTVFSEVKSDP